MMIKIYTNCFPPLGFLSPLPNQAEVSEALQSDDSIQDEMRWDEMRCDRIKYDHMKRN